MFKHIKERKKSMTLQVKRETETQESLPLLPKKKYQITKAEESWKLSRTSRAMFLEKLTDFVSLKDQRQNFVLTAMFLQL
jgi:hypothetical protein